jgi:2-oxopent-4-enoate hydratase
MGERRSDLEAIADRLWRAGTNAVAIPPIAAEFPDLTVPEAYAVQLRNIGRKLDAGDRVTGKKIGLTSAAMQDLLGVHQPDYGHLLASMDATHRVIDTGSLVQPRVEAELAFVLASDLPTAGVTPADVLAATEYVVGALEIVDSRISDWKIGILDTVADNASSGQYVLGEARLDPKQADLTRIGMVLTKNGTEINRGRADAVLGDPAFAVAWLANAVGEYGVQLRAGEVVLSGAMAAMIPIGAGDTVVATFDQLGEVTATFG